MLTKLLDDLVSLEALGLEDQYCQKIQTALRCFSNASTEVPSGGFLTGPIYKDIDKFEGFYNEWNSIKGI
jgi:hypothetical protein